MKLPRLQLRLQGQENCRGAVGAAFFLPSLLFCFCSCLVTVVSDLPRAEAREPEREQNSLMCQFCGVN